MFIQNFLNIFIASLFVGISFSYIFSLNTFFSCLISFLIFLTSFTISYLYSEKIYVKPIFRLYVLGMLISLIFVLFKIPFFPILSIQDIFYYSRARKLFEIKISSKEIGKVAVIFLAILLFFSIIGIIAKNFLLAILPSVLIISFLVPYPNSFGSILFFYNSFILSFFAIISAIFIILSIFF